jgi:hypothetical protein
MIAMNLSELGLYSHYVVVRTERANELIRRDPREMPRRLRLLLLAIDGQQDLATYASNLKGFGEILDLTGELIQMDMVRLVDPALARQQRMSGKSAEYMAMDSVMDDSRFVDSTQDSSQSSDDLFYGSTTPGGLERLIGYAQSQYPDYKPPAAAPAPIAPATQQEQIESVFKMLEAVRGERTELKLRLMRYRNLKKVSRGVHDENKQLKDQISRLKVTCGIMALGFITCLTLLLWRG